MDLKKYLFPLENPRHSNKWISGKELMDRWGRMGFELFDFMKQGLQAYTRYGKKIIDLDTLEREPPQPLEHFIDLIRGVEPTRRVLGSRSLPSTEHQIIEEAKLAFKSQTPKVVNPPEDCEAISFTIPKNEKKAEEVILKAMSFLFKMEEVLNFEREHGLVPQELRADPTRSAIRPSQDDRGLDPQKHIDKYLADGVPKEIIAVELKNKFKLTNGRIARLIDNEGLHSDQTAAFKTRGARLIQKGLKMIAKKEKEVNKVKKG